MAWMFWLKGLVLGFSIAAPVGPIGVLCIRRTLSDGRLAGLFTGLGAAAADGVYGLMAAGGLAAVSTFIVDQRGWLRLVGGLFLLFLGVKTFLSRAADTPARSEGRNLFSAWASTFFLTLTNPMTIIAFAAIFAGLGLVDTGGGVWEGGFLVAGVFSGSALWWVILSGLVGLFRSRIDAGRLTLINRLAGVVVVAFGVVSLVGK